MTNFPKSALFILKTSHIDSTISLMIVSETQLKEKKLWLSNYLKKFWKSSIYICKTFENERENSTASVWIPTEGGTKYHSYAGCSGMENPEQVTEEEAIKRGFERCGKCW